MQSEELIPSIISMIIFFIAIFLSKISIKLVVDLLAKANCIRLNYRQKEVVFGAGIAFLPVILLMTAFCMYFFASQRNVFIAYIAGICAMGFAGVVDDMIGEKDIKGFSKHIKSFLDGHLTTGFLKAFIGGLVSIIISISISKDIIAFMLNTLNIALFTNTLNLLDLRPGRCTKIFVLIGSIMILLNFNSIIAFLPLLIALAAALVYLGYDLKELSMLGDTGSNILGATLGFYSALSSTIPVKLSILFILLTINIAAEKISITALISNNKFLNYIDSFGRSS